jgi:hypothetical protein
MSLISLRSLSLLLKTSRVSLLFNLKVVLYSPAKYLSLISIPLIIRVLISTSLSKVIGTPLKAVIRTLRRLI